MSDRVSHYRAFLDSTDPNRIADHTYDTRICTYVVIFYRDSKIINQASRWRELNINRKIIVLKMYLPWGILIFYYKKLFYSVGKILHGNYFFKIFNLTI